MILITGVSSGIGLALVHEYIERGHEVVGIGRRNNFEHKNYSFIHCDLSNINEVKRLNMDFSKEKSITLINNAGVIGNIQRIAEQNTSDIEEVLNVNTIAPMLLSYKLLQLAIPDTTIVNISSGAGKRPIASWASYCASKAAIDLFSETIYLEEQERGKSTKVYSVSPGVIDSPMQEKIRSAGSSNFSSLDNFVALKEQNNLESPKVVAKKLIALLERPYLGDVVCSLRDVEL